MSLPAVAVSQTPENKFREYLASRPTPQVGVVSRDLALLAERNRFSLLHQGVRPYTSPDRQTTRLSGNGFSNCAHSFFYYNNGYDCFLDSFNNR